MNTVMGSLMARVGASLMPRMEGVIERRVLIGLRVRPEVAARLIPAPLQPRVVGGWCLGGVCLVRLGRLRPVGMPDWSGMTSENAACRLAVQWLDGGQIRDGVYIPERVTDSALHAVLGGRIFAGEQHRANFMVRESPTRLRIGFDRGDGEGSVKMVARVMKEWPKGSVFATHEEAAAFYREASIGWSLARDGARLEGMRLSCGDWKTEPLLVERLDSSWFQDRDRFPAGSVEFDSGLLMRNVRHTWRACGPMETEARCEPVAARIR